MGSIPDGRDAAAGGADDPGTIFDLGDQLAGMISRLDDEYTGRAGWEYRQRRDRLQTSLGRLLAPRGVPGGLVAKLVDEAFPPTLADVYETATRVGYLGGGRGGIASVARWSRDGWNRLQEVVLSFLGDIEFAAPETPTGGPLTGRGMYPTAAAFHAKEDEVVARLKADGTKPTPQLIMDGMYLNRSWYYELRRRYPRGDA